MGTMVRRDGMGRHGRSEDLCSIEIEIVVERLRFSYAIRAFDVDCLFKVEVGRGVGGGCGSRC